ncbi:MAG: class I SAM-dependent methyltransferase [bacterium]
MADAPSVPAGGAHEYDHFADIYDVWTETAASTQANLPFYVDAYLAAQGPVVELGVGDGRVAVRAAARGCPVIGVDASTAMLDLCRARATREGVTDRVDLRQADFRDFTLTEPADLIALPYHSIGHLTTLDDKRRALHQVFSQLRPGGRFIFDDFLMTPALITQMRQVQLRAMYPSSSSSPTPASGSSASRPPEQDTFLWVTSLVDESSQSLTVVTWEDLVHPDGRLDTRRYRRLSLSWLLPAQARQLLEETGFEVEACFGDFHRTPFADTTAVEQVWIARRPAADDAHASTTT